jgi:hypothetical protein
MLEHATSAVRYFRKHHGILPAAALGLGLGLEFMAKALWMRKAPFRGTRRQNLARLARFLLGVSYFERRAAARAPWRRLLLRVLEADLWSG